MFLAFWMNCAIGSLPSMKLLARLTTRPLAEVLKRRCKLTNHPFRVMACNRSRALVAPHFASVVIVWSRTINIVGQQ